MSTYHVTYLRCDMPCCDEEWSYSGKSLTKENIREAAEEGWQKIIELGDVCPEHLVSDIVRETTLAREKSTPEPSDG